MPGFEQTLLWDNALLAGVTTFTNFDAQGAAQLALNNPGVPQGLQLLVACAFVDSNVLVLGSTAAMPLTLAP